MSLHWPKIRLEVGDIVGFDGDRYEIVKRARDGRSGDRFVVNGPNGAGERHMDWFSEQAANAERVVVES